MNGRRKSEQETIRMTITLKEIEEEEVKKN